MSMKKTFERIKTSYVRFVEKQGFAIITTICVAVITATALWTDQQEDTYIAPTPPPSGDLSAARLMQQSLKSAVTASPLPTQTPSPWRPPLEEVDILRPYDSSTMHKGQTTGIWQIHDAVDLSAEPGTRVFALADGTILAAGRDRLLGSWLLIDHINGVQALYAGLSTADAYIQGDRVFGGDPIGYTGNGVLDEADLPPHLHLRVTQDKKSIDPALLWNSSVNAENSKSAD